MKHSFKTGISFGVTSGIITTLGLIVGLHSSTHSSMVVIGGILMIAISDALSDAMGIHISEESEHRHSEKEIWESTIATFTSKFLLSMSFIVPILLLDLSLAIVVCVLWGLSLIALFSLYLARRQGERPHKPILEHLAIASSLIVVTHFLGDWLGSLA